MINWRPWRFGYLAALAGLAWYCVGWQGVVFVVMASVQPNLRLAD